MIVFLTAKRIYGSLDVFPEMMSIVFSTLFACSMKLVLSLLFRRLVSVDSSHVLPWFVLFVFSQYMLFTWFFRALEQLRLFDSRSLTTWSAGKKGAK
jgi:hypothetical protein